MQQDVIRESVIVTAARSAGGTSVSVSSGPQPVTLPAVYVVYRGTAIVTALTVTAWSGQTMTVSATAPAGWVDADVHAADVLQGPQTVVQSSGGVASGLEIVTSFTPIVADTDGATITFDCSVSNFHSVTLGGNRTLALSNVTPGQTVHLLLTQDGTGSRTVTWFSGIRWKGASAPTLTTTAAHSDLIKIICTGAGAYLGTADLNYN